MAYRISGASISKIKSSAGKVVTTVKKKIGALIPSNKTEYVSKSYKDRTLRSPHPMRGAGASGPHSPEVYRARMEGTRKRGGPTGRGVGH